MVRRVYQVFRAPDDEPTDKLPIPPSPWHVGRVVRLPREQWELLLSYAESVDGGGARELARCSFDPDGALVIARSPAWLRAAISLIDQTTQKIDQFMPTLAGPEIEEFDQQEHKRMLEAVQCILRESLKLGKPFWAWLE